ncbi:NmrA family NAD(P)-binding protein [Verrucomicrobiaceae bacterium 5K15]|uniref:NmrA family NAD(P)-binding protein n=1 Tax=Oceaniferula flava TaxID=2800421 RepID=A0AAE2SAZ5_9BACT|nr:NmrA family NAD(P)-binding protein [Oceaniferula flavus]MBK1854107.1 NmrA family NAD(P)-binding protein [Oceaniferula flavus]MBM1135413.1 NmrA family NAD(P)-binding protein [Oceaniferula flavus]
MITNNPSTTKTKVAVVGATGQFGHPLTLNLASEGADVLAISRAPSERNQARLAELEKVGCHLGFCADPSEENALTSLLEGCDTVVMVTQASPESLASIDPHYLNAAKRAGVRKFVPNEFGCHTLGIERGISALFDAKKDMHERIDAAGLEKTLIYPGLNFDYCLPNLRLFHQVTTFADLDQLLTTHHIDDIGVIAARAILDPRTTGKAVQLYTNRLSQREMLALLDQSWPDKDFPIKHVSRESILDDMKNATDEVTAKAGVETDLERAQINYVCYITGAVTNIDYPNTLNAAELYPDFVYKTPAEMLADEAFVFGT